MIKIQNIKYNKREYIFDGNKNDFSAFEIREDKRRNAPESYTKYYALTDYSIESLLSNYIYACHPMELNDPLDCFFNIIDINEIKDEEIDYLDESLRTLNIFINKKNLQKDKENFMRLWSILLFGSSGIISLTDSKNENPILWANYTNKHCGFSLTYRKDSFDKIALGPFPVDYIEKFEKIKFRKENIGALTLCLSTIKSFQWKGEEEWRFIGMGQNMYNPLEHFGHEKTSKQQNRKLYLPKNTVSDIKLGFHFFDYNNIQKNNLDEYIVDLNKEAGKSLKVKLLSYISQRKIKLSMIFLDKNEFKLVSRPIDFVFLPEINVFKFKRIPSP